MIHCVWKNIDAVTITYLQSTHLNHLNMYHVFSKEVQLVISAVSKLPRGQFPIVCNAQFLQVHLYTNTHRLCNVCSAFVACWAENMLIVRPPWITSSRTWTILSCKDSGINLRMVWLATGVTASMLKCTPAVSRAYQLVSSPLDSFISFGQWPVYR